MNRWPRALKTSLLGSALLLGACGGAPEADPVPEGVSLEPPAEAPATGGVTTPGSTTPDSTVPVTGTDPGAAGTPGNTGSATGTADTPRS